MLIARSTCGTLQIVGWIVVKMYSTKATDSQRSPSIKRNIKKRHIAKCNSRDLVVIMNNHESLL